VIHRARLALLAAPALLLGAGFAWHGPIAQDQAYHAFADGRSLFGIPNAADTLSNLAFLLVGLWGLRWLRASRMRPPAVATPDELIAWSVLFASLALTGLGSAWYHLAPDDARLAWDRLPMAFAFASLFVVVFSERIETPRLRWLLAPALVLAAASVAWWSWTGDLRPYAFVQFYCIVALPLLVWLFPSRYTRRWDYWVLIGVYLAAKLAEQFDAAVFDATGVVSGHTLKHLLAAAGGAWLSRMLALRRSQG
jgi:hypothetical protein